MYSATVNYSNFDQKMNASLKAVYKIHSNYGRIFRLASIIYFNVYNLMFFAFVYFCFFVIFCTVNGVNLKISLVHHCK